MSKAQFGAHMRAESAEAIDVLIKSLAPTNITKNLPSLPQAIYTIARGSSDAAATILNYEFMRVLGIPSTTLPPSVFSLGSGISFVNSWVVTISQSGASADLVAATKCASQQGATTIAITNVDNSPVQAAAKYRLPIDAGQERAIPATKSVVGSVGAGLALIAALNSDYRQELDKVSPNSFRGNFERNHISKNVTQDLANVKHIYVVGRQSMFGAAQEIALKIKETCAVHAEAYSASEVLHGPMQLASNGLLTLLLDDNSPELSPGLDLAETQLLEAGSVVKRLTLTGKQDVPQGLHAALFLVKFYPQILEAALLLGINPDVPSSLSKVTQTY